MIFVTVGASLPFDRLIEYIDKEIAPELGKEKIIAQIHDSAKYIPRNIEYIKTVNKVTYDEYIKKSDLIISHAGMGIILDCIKYHKKLIIIPRDPKKQELVDSHQYEICKYLNKNYQGIDVIYDLDDLYDRILSALSAPPPTFENFKEKLFMLKKNLSQYLSNNYPKNSNIFVVCSSGGHLRQIMELIDIFPPKKTILITNTTKTKVEGIKMYVIKGNFTDKLLPLRAFFIAPYLILKYRPSLIFTNGGGELAVPFAYFGKIIGSKIFFMETISRITSKSKAAQLIYPTADTFLVQWKENLSKYGKKAKYWGSVL